MTAAAPEPPAMAAQDFFLTVQPTEPTARHVVHFRVRVQVQELQVGGFESSPLPTSLRIPSHTRPTYGALLCAWERHERSCSGLGSASGEC
jgi:hypothetical protein